MERKLIVVLDGLEESLRENIRKAAEQHGFSVSFYGRSSEALPFLTDAEIVLGQSAVLAKNAPALRWLCTPSAGVNQFTAPDCFANANTVLTNSSGAYGVTISEHIIMVTLELLRRQQEYNTFVLAKKWSRGLSIRSIMDSRITLLGTGDIGQETAIRLRAFNPAGIIGINRGGKNPRGLFDLVKTQELLDSVLSETDILIISLPGTAETLHMLDSRRLAMLPDRALIINVGRGTVIDQQALESELRSGRLLAALDVFEQEPLPDDDPLWTCPNLLITPHIAGNMTLPYTRRRIVELFLEDFENYCAGKPLARQVDLQRGY